MQDSEKKVALNRDEAIFSSNFLDEVYCDEPYGIWSVQKDSTGTVAVLRNHAW